MNDAFIPLRRLLPKRTWTDSHGRGMILWVVLYVASALTSLVLIALFVELIVTQGRLSPEALVQIQDKFGTTLDPNQQQYGLWAVAAEWGESVGWMWLPWFCRTVPLAVTNQTALSLLVGLGFLNSVVLMLARARSRYHAFVSARNISTWLQKSIHRQTLRLGPSDLSGQRHITAFKLFTTTVDEVRDAIVQYRWRLIRAFCLIPAMLIASLCIDWRLSIQCLVPAFASWWLYRYERDRGAAQRQLADSQAETEARFLADGLKKTRIVRGYGMEAFEDALFENHLSRLTTDSTYGRRLQSRALRLGRIVVAASVAIVILLIGLRVLSISNPLPLALAFSLAGALGVIIRESASLEHALLQRRQLAIESEKAYRFLDEIPEVGQAVGAKFIQPVSKAIVLETVHYSHQGHEILRGIDLRIEANTQVSLVSLDPLLPRAIAYLLPRFIEPTKGRVLFDGEDIAWGTLESIHAETLYVGGDDPVLSGSVLENLICGDSRFSMQDAIEAAKMVHVNKYISSLPLGYETILGEHGTSIGVGEAFQIGLARAILRDPAVLIIQEPDAILDENLRVAIDDAYQRISQGRTVIYLPSRLSTIRRSDQVVLLHDGKVEGLGNHGDLKKGSELYRHWDYITFNSFSRESRKLNAVGPRSIVGRS